MQTFSCLHFDLELVYICDLFTVVPFVSVAIYSNVTNIDTCKNESSIIHTIYLCSNFQFFFLNWCIIAQYLTEKWPFLSASRGYRVKKREKFVLQFSLLIRFIFLSLY